MNRQVGSLVAILLIQIALVVALYLPASDIMDTSAREPLIPFDPDAIDEIYVEDDQGNEAVLLKLADQWILPDLSGLPIMRERVDALIRSISDRDGQWPIATSSASRQRFQVAAYHFQRRITLIGEGELFGTIYLGTSPGFRKVHARNDAQDAIYSIPFNNFEAPTETDAWLDKDILQIAEPRQISSAEYTLTQRDERWISAQGNTPDAAELSLLLEALLSLEIEGVADQAMLENLAIAAPELTLDVDTADGVVNLTFLSVGERHFIRSSRYDHHFTLSAARYDRFLSIYAPALNNTVSSVVPIDTSR